MPIYTYQCDSCKDRWEHFETLSEFDKADHWCLTCWVKMERIIHAPLLVKVAPEVSYDSPITGLPITSMAARQEDLKRNQCTPYDPDQRTDYDRRVKESETELDTAIEATVEEAVSQMDGRTRAKLYSELVDQGVTAEAVRTAPDV